MKLFHLLIYLNSKMCQPYVIIKYKNVRAYITATLFTSNYFLLKPVSLMPAKRSKKKNEKEKQHTKYHSKKKKKKGKSF